MFTLIQLLIYWRIFYFNLFWFILACLKKWNPQNKFTLALIHTIVLQNKVILWVRVCKVDKHTWQVHMEYSFVGRAKMQDEYFKILHLPIILAKYFYAGPYLFLKSRAQTLTGRYSRDFGDFLNKKYYAREFIWGQLQYTSWHWRDPSWQDFR